MRRLRTAIAAGVLFCISPGHARADDAAQARSEARHAMVAGDLPRARALLSSASSPDAAAAERAAAAELMFVIDLWSSSGGRPPAVTGANDAPAPDAEDDWQHAFSNARNQLVEGRYAEAARRFDALVGSAPDLVAGARAAELRALAREAAPNVQPAPPVATTASPPPAPPSKPEKSEKAETRWYGWQTLLSDGLAVVATPLAPPLGVGIYFLGAPTVHIFHLEGFNVLKSLGVRVISPIVGGLVGLAAVDGCSGFLCELEGGAWGVVVGAGIAVLVDAALIAHEDVPAEKKEKKATIVPLLTPGRVGLGGTF